MNNLKQLGTAIKMYTADNNGWYMPHINNGNTWYVYLRNYYKDPKVLICPSDRSPTWYIHDGKPRFMSYPLNHHATHYVNENYDGVPGIWRYDWEGTILAIDGRTSGFGANYVNRDMLNDGRWQMRHNNGANVLYLDCHVEWNKRDYLDRNDNKMLTPQLD
ncbi:MAG: hypothetical protein NC921_00825 [Candidatus Omnitrophica bacterium]|nr:hypothetical protein [Candidatus Omnitrophota bacterium]